MSRIGKTPVKVPKGVKIIVQPGLVRVEGPKGKLEQKISEQVKIDVDAETVKISSSVPALHGVTRTVIANMIYGVATGFTRGLDIVGVGYRAAVKGSNLSLNLGFSHPVEFKLPEGVSAKVEKNTHIDLSGPDKVILGRVAAKIRSFRKPEPYQGKGVKYSDERIIRKAGKAAGGGAK